MKAKLLSLSVLGLLLGVGSGIADPTTDVTSFTLFSRVETSRLEGGGIQQVRGGGMMQLPAGLGAQALFMLKAPPDRVAAVLQTRDTTKHPELKVWMHEAINLTAPITPASFPSLARLPDNASVQALADDTAKLSSGGSTIQVSKDEIARGGAALTAIAGAHGSARISGMADFWSSVLSGRVNAYLAGRSQPMYEMGSRAVNPMEHVKQLLNTDPRVKRRFASLLARTPFKIGSATSAPAAAPIDPMAVAAPKGPTQVYYESFDVEGQAAIGTGALYVSSGKESIQIIDAEYFISNGVYVTLELYEIWPITVDGAPGSLVWRDELVTSPEVEERVGTEKMAAGLIMLQDVKQDVDMIREDIR